MLMLFRMRMVVCFVWLHAGGCVCLLDSTQEEEELEDDDEEVPNLMA